MDCDDDVCAHKCAVARISCEWSMGKCEHKRISHAVDNADHRHRNHSSHFLKTLARERTLSSPWQPFVLRVVDMMPRPVLPKMPAGNPLAPPPGIAVPANDVNMGNSSQAASATAAPVSAVRPPAAAPTPLGAPQIVDSNIARNASGNGAAGSHQEGPSLFGGQPVQGLLSAVS